MVENLGPDMEQNTTQQVLQQGQVPQEIVGVFLLKEVWGRDGGMGNIW